MARCPAGGLEPRVTRRPGALATRGLAVLRRVAGSRRRAPGLDIGYIT
jgi:hypothetical protein